MKYCVYFSTFLGVLCMLNACQAQDKGDNLTGTWKARWEMVPPTLDAKGYNMEGKIIFFEDYTVEITAYGYEGCVISADTIQHALQWKKSGDTLKLFNEGEESGLDYVIEKQTENEVRCRLIDDISLVLTK